MKNNQTPSWLFGVFFFCSLFCIQNSTAQELNSYIEQAVTNNPDLKGYELRYTIAQEKVNEANTLPDTEFGAGYFVSTPETRVGAQRARFSVRQMLPWFGTISARSNFQDALAESEYVNYTIAKRRLALEVAQNYYRIYGIQAKKQVLNQNRELLQTYEELALNLVEVGTATAVEFLKIKMRQNDLKARQEILEEELIAAKIQFNSILNVAENAPVLIIDSLSIPYLEDEHKITSELVIENAELLKYDKWLAELTQFELLNQRDALPKIGVGLDYIPVSERTDMNMINNGKDIVMPMISVSVPIFNSKYKSVSRQNELRQQEINSQRSQQLNTLKTLFAEAVKNRNTARINYETQLLNLEQANDAEEILLKNYETGTIDFNALLDIEELQLKFQIDQINAVQSYYEQSAQINYLILK